MIGCAKLKLKIYLQIKILGTIKSIVLIHQYYNAYRNHRHKFNMKTCLHFIYESYGGNLIRTFTHSFNGHYYSNTIKIFYFYTK